MAAYYVYSFIMLKTFPLVVRLVGLHGCILLYACTSAAGALFVIFYVPETKGKSFAEINRMLSGRQKNKSISEGDVINKQ